MRAPSIFALMAIVPLLMTSRPAGAEPTSADKTTARVLFDDGRKLANEGNYGAACAKFEESNRLDPGAGVMFHLADCYEKTGRNASAWQLFLEVALQMRNDRQEEREKAARQRAAAIEPRLSRVTIQVDDQARVPGLVVKRDGRAVGEAVWGSAVPVDPGKHVIEATSPGKKPFVKEVLVETPGSTMVVQIPVLSAEAATAAPAAAPAPTTSPAQTQPPAISNSPRPEQDAAATSSHSSQRTLGLIVGGAGVVGLGVGTVLAFGARSKYDEAEPFCSGNVCLQEGKDLRDQGISRGNVATIVGGIGLAAMVGGAVLWFTAPKPSKPAPATALIAGPGSIAVGGTW